MIRFAVGPWPARRRLAMAAALFSLAAAAIALLPLPLVPAGLLLAVAGHVVLWVRTQTTSPGGATPFHEEIWAPVEEDWMDRVRDLEERGRKWDTSLFDLTNVAGFAVVFALVVATAGAAVAILALSGVQAALRVALGAGILLLPLWINGIRTTWNPSELHKKGEALEAALRSVEADGAGDFEPVPMLALREGERGKYPVDAKVMLRPRADEGSGVLGVQLQVAMNSVQGTDYPYLYAVVLVEEDARLPNPKKGKSAVAELAERRLVYETGRGDGARFLVVRQHADRSGGWHTETPAIHWIVLRALELARQALRENRP